jgi:transposase InsO family protein
MNSETKLIKSRVGVLNLAEQLDNVTHACKLMGTSRDSFYRIKDLYNVGGEETLREISRRKPILKNRLEPEVEGAAVQMAFDNPAFGQARACNQLCKNGIFISAAAVSCVWQRLDLEVFSKRLKALEARVAQEGLILTEAQFISLERKKEKLEACGEIETEHPGYLVAQDTYYVGTIKGLGRIYQQTVIDTYTRVVFAKLYTSKHAITSADVLNDQVIPFFEQQEISILRMLTDGGAEFNGRPENHEYELYLQLENIDHSKTKIHYPQSNGICERLHRTIQDEFYVVAFRRKMYLDLAFLQTDLDDWIKHYNEANFTAVVTALVKPRFKPLWNPVTWL